MSKNARLLAMFVIASSLGLYLAYRERGVRESAMANPTPPTPSVSSAPDAPAPVPAAPAAAQAERPLRPNPEDVISTSDRPLRPKPEDIIRPATPVGQQPTRERAVVRPAEPPALPRTRDN